MMGAEVPVEDRNRFRALIDRGSELRLERAGALYEFYQNLETMRGVLDATPTTRRFLDLALDFIRAQALSDNLEVYMGSSNTDAYGLVTDAEVGRPEVRFGLKFAREMPRRRLFVEMTMEEAVELNVAVDRHRAKGEMFTADVLLHVLPLRVWRVLEEQLDDVEESAQDRQQLLDALARALDAQSILRVLVLAESFPSREGA